MFAFGLTVVRHGETRYNKERLLQGQGVDEPLSATGIKQAEAAGLFLQNVVFTSVFSSDLQRAKQTASIILSYNSNTSGIEICYDPRLRERGFGVAEGKPIGDMKTMAKAAGQPCPHFTPPGGETLEQVRSRVKVFINTLCQEIVAKQESQPFNKVSPLKSIQDYLNNTSERLPATTNCVELQENCQESSNGTLDIHAHVLVVSHGTYIRNMVKYFVDDLQCTFPKSMKMSHAFSACPNTGMCHFVVTVDLGNKCPRTVDCIFINRKDHLEDIKDN
ncbi:fructose-2,6-bisphosphatase TIGAR B-like [Erpetoichthys calabaricus]|uniref:fructose-2,6-bisphosphatase TIGAR B-like n=1 Tax=Erpetoichthys calabaricus TaxID=27687 RepID=UPI002234C543|nr:fructose-2,6-bisphosphatase TIGAR B-like [Erpetoichthys calabaricus]